MQRVGSRRAVQQPAAASSSHSSRSAAASSRQLQQPVASIRLIAAKIETLEPTRMPKRSCVRVAQEMRPP
jgi:hypothetical protein